MISLQIAKQLFNNMQKDVKMNSEFQDIYYLLFHIKIYYHIIIFLKKIVICIDVRGWRSCVYKSKCVYVYI